MEQGLHQNVSVVEIVLLRLPTGGCGDGDTCRDGPVEVRLVRLSHIELRGRESLAQ
jgi:hypothetical protein